MPETLIYNTRQNIYTCQISKTDDKVNVYMFELIEHALNWVESIAGEGEKVVSNVFFFLPKVFSKTLS